ncbi:MAG: M20/M25/M40 family metallo-hydrolase [Candidatus Marinimicrobia bacterium]|nr:M20/M25/M40 family metallo-hydrolase [Candidatus Neomarinimicrobiota bacterium]MDD5582796.1 M20/M25/M40 family metallo-hydrolase [Candidatus Neomarinimicrobiota bacterium]
MTFRKRLGLLLNVCLIGTTLIAQDSLFLKIRAMMDSVSTEKIRTHIQMLEYAGGYESRVTFTPGKDSAMVYIADYFRHHTHVSTVTLDTFYVEHATAPYNTYPLVNVIAKIPGTGTPSRYVVLGAHYDASASRMSSNLWQSQWNTIKAPGADDNATGVAVLLEIARVMSDTSFHFSEEYGIVFVAFAAEESNPMFGSGHQGSLHFVSSAKENKDDILGAVSIDMIGYNANYPYTAIVSNKNSEWLGLRAAEINDMYHLGLLMNNPPYPFATYSDHDRFWEQGYPAILMIENAPPWENGRYYVRNYLYHTSYDTLGSVNLNLVTKVAQLNLGLAADLTGRVTAVPLSPIPQTFVLSQNYPNPFNPTTTIEYTIATAGNVQLVIFDIQGRKKAQVINEYHEPGVYSVTVHAEDFSSGIYLYQLISGSYVQTKKMTVLK